MSARRTLILVVAIVLAVIAAVGVYGWLNGVQDRAYDNAKRVKVYKVVKDIPKGTAGEAALSEEAVKADEAPQEFRPATALTNINDIRAKVALTKLTAGQIVVDGMFVDPRTAQVTAAQRIPAGQVAVSVRLDDVKAVGGLLVPGDKVNILIGGPKQTTPPNAGAVQHLFQNVTILFIGTTAAPEAGETQQVVNPGSGVITFAVPPVAAEKIVFASQMEAGIYLTLVPPDNQPLPVPGINAGNLLQGGLTPDQG